MSRGAESFVKMLSNELNKRFPKCGGMVEAYAFVNMLNPFYRGIGVECISKSFQEMYETLILKQIFLGTNFVKLKIEAFN